MTRRSDPDDSTIIIDAEIVTDWLHAADQREDPLWAQVESLLTELQEQHPIRARKARMAIRWLRHEALAHDLSWGKELNSYGEAEKGKQSKRTRNRA